MDEKAGPAKREPGGTHPATAKGHVTAPDFRTFKQRGEKIVIVTAYDYPSALLAERAGVDCILVGDSLGMVVQGHETTLSVTLDETIYHTRAVRRGASRPLVVADLPFGSYQASAEDAIRSAMRLLKEGGAHAVKMEGGGICEAVRRMTAAGIPVMGHLGLTPQSVNVFGGFRAQGKDNESARRIIEDARALEMAGTFAIVLESIPSVVSQEVSTAIQIPTIGIGAGPHCDGQVQVWHDLLGILPGKTLRHVKRYAETGEIMESALRAYADDVRLERFPTKEHSL